MATKAVPRNNKPMSKSEFKDKEKPAQIRGSNIVAAKGIIIIIFISGPRNQWWGEIRLILCLNDIDC